jgi:hypothetical protein
LFRVSTLVDAFFHLKAGLQALLPKAVLQTRRLPMILRFKSSLVRSWHRD